MITKEVLHGELDKIPEISELLLVILSRIPRNDREEIVDLHTAINKNLLEVKTLLSNMKVNHLTGKERFETIHFPIYIQHMLYTKRMVNNLYRHVNLLYRGIHYENIQFIKDTITNLIKILSHLMEYQINHGQQAKGKRTRKATIR
jgi:hypothetical protein